MTDQKMHNGGCPALRASGHPSQIGICWGLPRCGTQEQLDRYAAAKAAWEKAHKEGEMMGSRLYKMKIWEPADGATDGQVMYATARSHGNALRWAAGVIDAIDEERMHVTVEYLGNLLHRGPGSGDTPPRSKPTSGVEVLKEDPPEEPSLDPCSNPRGSGEMCECGHPMLLHLLQSPRYAKLTYLYCDGPQCGK